VIRPVLLLTLGWFLAGLAGRLISQSGLGNGLIEAIKAASNGSLNYDMALLVVDLSFSGLLSGVALWASLRSSGIHPTGGQVAALLVAWTVGFILILFFNPLEAAMVPNIYGDFLAGALGGVFTALLLRRHAVGFDRGAFLRTVLGWGAAVILGGWLIRMVYFNQIYADLESSLGWDFAWGTATPLFGGLFHGVGGLVGGLIMFSLLAGLAAKRKAPALET
jgi:hypothetical protein